MLGKIIAVAGPTASGKTALAIEIAKRFDGEVVSCDSMQIYRHMNIGTAKPTASEQAQVRHHMIDILEPFESFSVADFVKEARGCIDDILRRGKLPVIAGGTGLYMDSVIENIAFDDFGSDPAFREELLKKAEEEGVDAVHRLLEEIDPHAAEKIHPNNVRRVIRALEVCHMTGKTFTQVNLESRRKPLYDALLIGLEQDREVIYERINLRVDKMIQDGLVEEAKRLLGTGIGRETTAMQAIGYKELIDYFQGIISLSEAVEKIKMESRRYAKRQMTWFRRNEKINWVKAADPQGTERAMELCREFLL